MGGEGGVGSREGLGKKWEVRGHEGSKGHSPSPLSPRRKRLTYEVCQGKKGDARGKGICPWKQAHRSSLLSLRWRGRA